MERVVGTLFALTLVSGAVRASAEPKRQADPHKLLRVADADGDAQVSRGELEQLVLRHVQAQVRSRFSRLDRNADGRVSRAEVPSMVAARFKRFDLNADSYFTIAELAQVMRSQASRHCSSILAKLDTDGDGVVTRLDVERVADERLVRLDLKLPSVDASK